jgi:hypothetical protein
VFVLFLDRNSGISWDTDKSPCAVDEPVNLVMFTACADVPVPVLPTPHLVPRDADTLVMKYQVAAIKAEESNKS